MSLIAEDGSGLVDAESYCSVAEADSYFARRGALSWSELQLADKEVALLKATEAIDLLFGSELIGDKLKSDQGLEFPRVTTGIYSYSLGLFLPRVVIGIESNLKRATFEFAIRTLDRPIMPDVIVQDSEISSISKEVAGLKKSVSYFEKRSISLDPVIFRVPLAYMNKYIAPSLAGTLR